MIILLQIEVAGSAATAVSSFNVLLAVTGSKTGILIRAACTTAVTGLAVRVAHVAPGTPVTAHPSEAGFAMTGPRCQTSSSMFFVLDTHFI